MITETGIWSEEEKIYHANSEDLLNRLLNTLNPNEPVIDFGCGTGYYMKELGKRGFKHLYGVEGTEVKKDNGDVNFIVADLSQDFTIPGIIGQVISLEVGEHIPEKYEQTFINNITKHCNSKLIMSWAIPNQPGIGHVNCKPLEYIINCVCDKGFKYNDEESLLFRNDPHTNTIWFKNTILIFEKK
jgi:2-polyprenyl-3-methyl-5-hydroxy-6-metoxy-1,4-benzoquinol methylase